MIAILSIFTTILLPIYIGFYYWKKKEFFQSFLLGIVSFCIIQWILRPFCLYVASIFYAPLGRWQETGNFETFHMVLLLAFTAGLFEEVGRFVTWKIGKKQVLPTFSDAIAFGFGHSGLEAVGGIGMMILMNMKDAFHLPLDLSSMMLICNRPIAMCVHCVFTVVVFYGIQKHKILLFVIVAVLFHTLLDMIGGTLMLAEELSLSWSSTQLSFVVAIAECFMALCLLFSFKKRKWNTTEDTEK